MESTVKAVNDLQLAAFLLATGYQLVKMEGDRQHRTFYFSECPEDIELLYCQSGPNVNARQLMDAYYQVKTLIFGRK